MKFDFSLKIYSSLIAFLLLSACSFNDPAYRDEVSPCWSEKWDKPPYGDTLAQPCEVAYLEFWKMHEGDWEAVELVDLALRNNPLTRVTWQNARAAAFNWRASKSTLYPSVSLTEQLLFQKVGGPSMGEDDVVSGSAGFAASTATALNGIGAASFGGGGVRSFKNYNQWMISNLSFSYLLFDFGGRSASIEVARQALLAANWNHNRNLQTVVLEVLTDYYFHLQAKALFLAREADLKDAKANVDAAEGRFQGGVATKLDVLLAKSNLANNQLLLEQQRGAVKTTLGRLATSVGMPADTIFSVAKLPDDIKLETIHESMEGLIDIAKKERPDLAAAEANWLLLRQQTIVDWSEGMPTLVANGNVQQNSNIHFPSVNTHVYNASLFLNVPLFDGFYYVNNTRATASEAKAALADWKVQEINVVLEVVTSYYNFTTAVETVKFSEELLKYTNEAYEAAMASYRNGTGTILDVLAAQSALSNARAQYIQARTQWITSLTNVAYATGQL